MKKFYSGQILAIVLVVLVVGVIIALALISRTVSDQRGALEEGRSADSLEIADTVLDSFRDVAVEDIVQWSEDKVSDGTIADFCDEAPDNTYSFGDEGICTISNPERIEELLADLSGITGLSLLPYYNSAYSTLSSECGYDDSVDLPDDIMELEISILPEDSEITIEQDDVFAIVTSAVPASSCSINLTAEEVDTTGTTGLIVSTIYDTKDANGEVMAIKQYEEGDINGYCLSGYSNPANCAGSWSNWTVSPTSPANIPPISNLSGSHRLGEVRLRAVGGDVTITRSLSPAACMETNDLLSIRTVINCGGNSRGKQYIISNEQWAPPIFDYVLFNGEGQLRNL